MLEKLKSRKLWVTVLTAVLVSFADELGLDVSVEQITGLVALAVSYTVVQGAVDHRAAAFDGGW